MNMKFNLAIKYKWRRHGIYWFSPWRRRRRRMKNLCSTSFTREKFIWHHGMPGWVKQSRTGQARQTKQDSNERDEGLKRNGYDAVYTRVNPLRDTERTYSLDKYMRVNLNHFILVLPDGFSLTTRWVDAWHETHLCSSNAVDGIDVLTLEYAAAEESGGYSGCRKVTF